MAAERGGEVAEHSGGESGASRYTSREGKGVGSKCTHKPAADEDAAARSLLRSLRSEEWRERALHSSLCERTLAVARRTSVCAEGPFRQGASWSGTIGNEKLILLIAHYQGERVEAVAVYPGSRAMRMEGVVVEHPAFAASGANASQGEHLPRWRLFLSEEETLMGQDKKHSRFELALREGERLEGCSIQQTSEAAFEDQNITLTEEIRLVFAGLSPNTQGAVVAVDAAEGCPPPTASSSRCSPAATHDGSVEQSSSISDFEALPPMEVSTGFKQHNIGQSGMGPPPMRKPSTEFTFENAGQRGLATPTCAHRLASLAQSLATPALERPEAGRLCNFEELVALGFPADLVAQALEMCEGHPEKVLDVLLKTPKHSSRLLATQEAKLTMHSAQPCDTLPPTCPMTVAASTISTKTEPATGSGSTSTSPHSNCTALSAERVVRREWYVSTTACSPAGGQDAPLPLPGPIPRIGHIKCPDCEQQIMAKFLAEHREYACKRRLADCDVHQTNFGGVETCVAPDSMTARGAAAARLSAVPDSQQHQLASLLSSCEGAEPLANPRALCDGALGRGAGREGWHPTALEWRVVDTPLKSDESDCATLNDGRESPYCAMSATNLGGHSSSLSAGTSRSDDVPDSSGRRPQSPLEVEQPTLIEHPYSHLGSGAPSLPFAIPSTEVRTPFHIHNSQGYKRGQWRCDKSSSPRKSPRLATASRTSFCVPETPCASQISDEPNEKENGRGELSPIVHSDD